MFFKGTGIYRLFVLSCLLMISFGAYAQQVELQYPVISGYGGVVTEPSEMMPTEGAKILIDLTTGHTTRTGVNSGLNGVARLINLYALAGINPDALDIGIVIHSKATPTVLDNAAYKEKYGKENPDLPLINALKAQGVKVMVCGQSFTKSGYARQSLNPSVVYALSAITTLVTFQQQGYQILDF